MGAGRSGNDLLFACAFSSSIISSLIQSVYRRIEERESYI